MSIFKKIAAVVLAAGVGVGAYSVAGCQVKSNTNENNNQQTEQTNPNNPSVGPNNPSVNPNENTGSKDKEDKEKDQKLLQEKVGALNTFLDKLTEIKNFTYKAGNYDALFDSKQDCDLAKFSDSGVETYVQDFGDTSFEYSLGKDNLWHKVVSDKDIPSIITDFVESTKSLKWSLDDSKNLIADFEGDKVTAKNKTDSLTLDFENGDDITVNVGKTQVNLPSKDQIVDETVQDEYIYTKENGWNTQLLAKTLEDWMKKNDYYGEMTFNKDAKMEKLLYVDVPKDDKLTFTIIFSTPEKKYLHELKLSKTIFNDVKSNDKYDVDMLINKLNITNRGIATSAAAIEFEYSTFDDDFDSHKEECELLTKNVFERLETVGTQNYANSEGKKIESLKDDNIIFVAKVISGDVFSGLGLGNKKDFSLIFLTKNNEGFKWERAYISSSVDQAPNELHYVKQDSYNDNWLITSFENKTIDYICLSNLDIFEKSKEI